MSTKSGSSNSIIITEHERDLSDSMGALAVPVAFRFFDKPDQFIVKSRTVEHSPQTETITYILKYEKQLLEP